jgi:hypothetical protein
VPLLAAKTYDPGIVTTFDTSAVRVFGAFDTTNLSLTFTAPPSGNVLVRIQVPMSGAATFPQVLLGVRAGSFDVLRVAPKISVSHPANTSIAVAEAMFTVGGLLPGSSSIWDAAYQVTVPVAGTAFRLGGLNNLGNSADWGAFLYEIWSA